MENKIIDQVKDYYGKQLQSKADLKTIACSCTAMPSKELREILALIADEIKDRFYGCGSPLPQLLDGMTVLDLGCGTGRDVYIVSKLIGEKGKAIGVDMTTEQLDVARKYQEEQAKRFGFSKSNVIFKQGYIEDLKSIGIEDNSVDVVISNCVINLSPAKKQVFKEIYRILKPGGELYFSDVFADRRIPDELVNDPVLYGECITGALYVEDFRRMMAEVGFADVRYTEIRDISITEEEFNKVGLIDFSSRTVRAFKIDDLEDICEDYGQVAIYDGSISGHPHCFDLDLNHRFITHKPMLVCGNTASMVLKTRYAKAFKVIGDRSKHYGKFGVCGNGGASTEVETGGCC